MWTTNTLKDRQSFEVEVSGFRVRNLIEENLILEGDKNENEGTRIEEYEEKFQTIFNHIILEKENLEEIVSDCLSTFPEDNRTKELIRKFNDLFSTTLFSSSKKTESMNERTVVTSERVEEGNQTTNSDFVGDTRDGMDKEGTLEKDMNTKVVGFQTVEPLQEMFPDSQERQTEVPETNVDDQITLGLEENIGEETVGEKNGEGNVGDNSGQRTVGEEIVGEKTGEANIIEKTVGDNTRESSIVTPTLPKHNLKETDDNYGGKDEDEAVGGNEEQIVDEKGKKVENVVKRAKRKVITSDVYRSPFVNRVVDLSEKVSTEQGIMTQIMFRCAADKDRMEMLFETEPGDIMYKEHFESMRTNHKIHHFVVDC